MRSSQQIRNAVLAAFLKVRDGWAAEYIVCDPTFNGLFIAACRESGASTEGELELNSALLNLRKRGELSGFPTTRRKPKGSSSQQNSVGNAIRFLERQFKATLDHIMCDPAMRAEFDSLMAILLPGCSATETRFAALTLRKKRGLQPEVVGRVVESVGGAISPILDLDLSLIPKTPGAYLFFDRENTLYAGKADSLRRRVEEHLNTWTARELLTQIRSGKRDPVFLTTHVLKQDVGARTLGAYETEIIRSRGPSHNIAGKER